ncbi:MAG TPA: 2-dehydropantoate 2-reductase [Acidobacteriota bacterium]|nr:2-dehydropantoate 2-reductase [Acidobacteriota bacterium]
MTELSPTYVIGAGSIGLFVQYLLQPIVSSVLVARPASCDRLNQSPLRLTGAVESSLQMVCQPWETLTRQTLPTTLVIATKAHEVPEVLQMARVLFPPGSTLILCQNGIGIFESARHQLPDWTILRLHCWMGIQRRAPDHIHVAGIYKFDLAGAPEAEAHLTNWHTILRQTPVPITIGRDPHSAEWQKALWNITVNGLCSIVNAPNGAILDFPELRTVAESIIFEAVAVAQAAGIALTQADVTTVFDSLEKTRTNINATLQDLRAGRHPELEFFNQAVVQTAALTGCPAPLNTLVVQLVNYLEKTRQRKEV